MEYVSGTLGTLLGGMPAAPAQPKAPTAADVVASIQRGQAAAGSLSKAVPRRIPS